MTGVAPYSLWLDSSDHNHPNGKASLFFSAPAERLEARGNIVTITGAQGVHTLEGNPFDVLATRMKAHPGRWAAGLFGYDLGRTLERLPASITTGPDIPDMAVGIYEAPQSSPAQIEAASGNGIEFKPTIDQETFESRVQTIIDYIYAGDIYQANFSQRFAVQLPRDFDSFAHYLHLRDISPAPFSGFMHWPLGDEKSFQIASTSPERFLKLGADGAIETRPIKGTRARGQSASEDQEIMRALQMSEKDRSENLMIVDLLRNDLSKVCTAHSVQVPELFTLESFQNVHHLVSAVTGQLRGDCGPIDLLKACFPGGSITGAPKIRAMEIIEELEDVRRGPYCGCVGYIAPDGEMDMNILIRTLIFEETPEGKQAHFNVGGGIVADSDPGAEYQETLDKAAGILKSFKIYQKEKQAA